ncbi:MAG: Cna B-type domain-containing protein [Clostridiales bacterium]|nr:Cna B-type domain-containing protein [Candidatus Crickella caballi]
MKNIFRKVIMLVLGLIMLVSFIPTSVFAAGGSNTGNGSNNGGMSDLGAPDVSKTLKSNGDGTYKLSLSVTGKSKASSESTKADVIIIFDRSNSMNNTADGSTRLKLAQGATNILIDTLLANNTQSAPDKVHVGLVEFGGRVVTDETRKTTHQTKGPIRPTKDAGKLKSAIGQNTVYKGTNWEEALQTAYDMLQNADEQEVREDSAKYIIFVTDGVPTIHSTKVDASCREYSNSSRDRNNDQYIAPVAYGTGSETGGAGQDNVRHCYDVAARDGGPADRISEAGYSFYGIGAFGNFSTTVDGKQIDLLKTLSEDVIGGKYYSVDNTQKLEEAFNDIVDDINKNFAYEGVKLTDGITDLTSMDNVNGSVYDFKYTYIPKGGKEEDRKTWSNAPAVIFTSDEGNNKQVTWDLSRDKSGHNFTLEDGVTYSVSFTVWPSQRAYDIATALANGSLEYGNTDTPVGGSKVTEDEWNQLTDDGDLKTNTSAKCDYTQIKEETGKDPVLTPGSVGIPNPDPIPLTNKMLRVYKEWIGGEGTGDIQLKLLQDGEETGKIITLNSGNNWSEDIHIAPGLEVDDEILEAGHDYELEEVDTGYKYEFESTTCHPMLIDSATDVKNLDGSICELKGTNIRRSNLEITKAVTGKEEPDNTLFTYRVTVKDKNGDDVWFSISDGTDVIKTEGRVTDATAEEKDGAKTGYYYADSNTPVTIKIKAGENIFFTNLPKGSTYEVEEINIPYEYELEKVVNDGEDQSSASASGMIDDNSKTFTVAYSNKYIKPVEVELIATKKVEGKDATEPFTFSVALASGEESNVVMPEDKTATTVADIKADGEETVAFGKIKFIKTGTYTFDVRETNANAPAGWTYDNSSAKTITVVVEKQDGKLVASVEGNNPTFTNKYAPEPTTASISATKVLQGDNAPDITGKYTFKLAAVTDNAPMPEITEKKNPDTDGGNVSFGDITYTKAGTYEYTVTESGEVDHITNDPTASKSVTVKVSDDNGKLKAEITEGEDLTFTNIYAPEATTASIPVTKELSGDNAPDITGKYTFTLAAETENAPMPATTVLLNPSRDGGDMSFGTITYTKAGTYEYTVTESGEVAGVTNDKESTKHVTVKVEDKDGKLVATITEGAGLKFTNNYKAAKTSVELSVTKELKNLTLKEGQFTFQLLDMSGNVVDEKQNAADGSINFKELEYEAAGTHKYIIKEVTPDGTSKGITYDTHEVDVTVEVTDDSTGQLKAKTSYDGSTKFVNTYNAKGESGIKGQKILNNKTLKDGDFTFTLSSEDGKLPDTTEVTNLDGIVDFGTIKFTLEDLKGEEEQTFHYVVKESGELAGVANDTDDKTFTITIKDNGDGTIETSTDPAEDMLFTFTNTYTGAKTSLSVAKALINPMDDSDLWNTDEYRDAEFKFTLKPVKNAPMSDENGNPVAGEVTVTKDSRSASFGQIAYDRPGTYEYIIKETKDSLDNVEYDEKEHSVKVEVSNERSGEPMTAEVKYDDDSSLTVTNKLKLDKKIAVTKHVVDTAFDELKVTGSYYVGIFDNTESDKAIAVKELAFTGQSSQTVTFDVPSNKKFIIYETDKEGNKLTGKQTQTTEEGKESEFLICFGDPKEIKEEYPQFGEVTTNKDAQVELSNVYSTDAPPPHFYKDGTLNITKKVELDGKAENVSDTFYVTVFSKGVDGSCAPLYIDGKLAIAELDLDNASEAEATIKEIPLGEYMLKETDADGNEVRRSRYTASFDNDTFTVKENADTYTFDVELTNSITKTEVPVSKIWEDIDGSTDYEKPDKVEVELLVNGKSSGKKLELNENNGWSNSFTNLPEYDENDEVIEYSVAEVEVDGFASEVKPGDAGYVITNTPEMGDDIVDPTSLKIEKVDSDDADKKLEGAVFEITKDGVTVDEVTTGRRGVAEVDLDSEGTYTVTETKAPKGYVKGETTSWTVTVEKSEPTIEKKDGKFVKHYTLLIDDLKDNTLTVENPHKKQLCVTKKVVDQKGNSRKYTGTFYITFFKDAAMTDAAETVAIRLHKQSQKTVKGVELEDGTYYVAETDAKGNVVDRSFKFKPKYNMESFEYDNRDKSVTVSIEVTNVGTEETFGPKTGDDADIALPVVSMTAAIMAIALVLVLRRRRGNN